jgi:hypothetical protein
MLLPVVALSLLFQQGPTLEAIAQPFRLSTQHLEPLALSPGLIIEPSFDHKIADVLGNQETQTYPVRNDEMDQQKISLTKESNQLDHGE